MKTSTVEHNPHIPRTCQYRAEFSLAGERFAVYVDAKNRDLAKQLAWAEVAKDFGAEYRNVSARLVLREVSLVYPN